MRQASLMRHPGEGRDPRRTACASLLAWIPAFAGMTMLITATPAHAQEMKPIRSITVNGLAQRKVVPDEAHINVNLNAQNKDMAIAKTAHNQKLEKLMAIVKKAGIDEKKVRTQSSSIQPVYTYHNDAKGQNQRVFEGYRVQTSVDITVGDTSKLAGLMDEISTAGFEKEANTEWGNLMSVYYTLSNPDKIRDDMLADAVANAKSKAERLADASGGKLGALYSINEGGTPQFQPMMAAAPRAMMMKGEAAGDASFAAPPAGEQQVESNVTVTYELK